MQKTFITGNLGADCEVRTTQAGKQLISFNVACTEREITTWYNCTIFNERLIAANFDQYLKKGVKVLLIGKYIPKIWTDEQGEAKLDHAFYVHEVELMSRAEHANSNPQQQPKPQQENPAPEKMDNGDDDLPF